MKLICLFIAFVGSTGCPVMADPIDSPTESKHAFVNALMEQMTLDEKTGQLTISYGPGEKDEAASLKVIGRGQTGAIIGAKSAQASRRLQNAALNSRLKIPLFFGFDVIHGYRTIFPIDLGLASSWDLSAIAESGRIAAHEASAEGIDMTFAPMVDISRDPRWGRVAESFGEDTYLVSRIATVLVNAFQGPLPIARDRIMSSVKHFALYGAAEGGRDYNSVDMSQVQMFQDYFPPFRAAIDAGAGSVMIALNSINGEPATSNSWLLHGVLRKRFGFKGMTLGDFNAVDQLVDHGVAANFREATRQAIVAGLDMSMADTSYSAHLVDLADAREIGQTQIDNAVRNVLGAKYDMGLFSDPYLRLGGADGKLHDDDTQSPLHRTEARDVARKTLVLLKNKDQLLPLKKSGTIALIGPLADSALDQMGSWSGRGDASQVVTLYDGLKAAVAGKGSVIYARGANVTDNASVINYLGEELVIDKRPAEVMIAEALKVAAQADVVIAVLGESRGMSGEGGSRVSLNLPGRQRELLTALETVGKPIILVLMGGRPLSISVEQDQVGAILESWFSGTEGGNAIADVLFGDYNPSGKLPVTFPRSVGQIPNYYNHLNTGRPLLAGKGRNFTSIYYDSSDGPLYPFGYGLSYTDFSLSDLKLSDATMNRAGSIDVGVNLENVGLRDGETVVQFYIQQLIGSISRPVKELKGFQKILLKAGEARVIHFKIDINSLKFYNAELNYAAEPGKFNVQIGLDSQDVQQANFQLLSPPIPAPMTSLNNKERLFSKETRP